MTNWSNSSIDGTSVQDEWIISLLPTQTNNRTLWAFQENSVSIVNFLLLNSPFMRTYQIGTRYG